MWESSSLSRSGSKQVGPPSSPSCLDCLFLSHALLFLGAGVTHVLCSLGSSPVFLASSSSAGLRQPFTSVLPGLPIWLRKLCIWASVFHTAVNMLQMCCVCIPQCSSPFACSALLVYLRHLSSTQRCWIHNKGGNTHPHPLCAYTEQCQWFLWIRRVNNALVLEMPLVFWKLFLHPLKWLWNGSMVYNYPSGAVSYFLTARPLESSGKQSKLH